MSDLVDTTGDAVTKTGEAPNPATTTAAAAGQVFVRAARLTGRFQHVKDCDSLVTAIRNIVGELATPPLPPFVDPPEGPLRKDRLRVIGEPSSLDSRQRSDMLFWSLPQDCWAVQHRDAIINQLNAGVRSVLCCGASGSAKVRNGLFELRPQPCVIRLACGSMLVNDTPYSTST